MLALVYTPPANLRPLVEEAVAKFQAGLDRQPGRILRSLLINHYRRPEAVPRVCLQFGRDGRLLKINIRVVDPAEPLRHVCSARSLQVTQFDPSLHVDAPHDAVATDVAEAAIQHLLLTEVARRMQAQGRELVTLTREELDSLIDQTMPARSCYDRHGASLDYWMLHEAALAERRERLEGSHHERMEAMRNLPGLEAALEDEARVSCLWWNWLDQWDRDRRVANPPVGFSDTEWKVMAYRQHQRSMSAAWAAHQHQTRELRKLATKAKLATASNDRPPASDGDLAA